MCEINPKFSKFFILEVYASPADTISKEEFEKQVYDLVLRAEVELNASRFRFHAHETPAKAKEL